MPPTAAYHGIFKLSMPMKIGVSLCRLCCVEHKVLLVHKAATNMRRETRNGAYATRHVAKHNSESSDDERQSRDRHEPWWHTVHVIDVSTRAPWYRTWCMVLSCDRAIVTFAILTQTYLHIMCMCICVYILSLSLSLSSSMATPPPSGMRATRMVDDHDVESACNLFGAWTFKIHHSKQ